MLFATILCIMTSLTDIVKLRKSVNEREIVCGFFYITLIKKIRKTIRKNNMNRKREREREGAFSGIKSSIL